MREIPIALSLAVSELGTKIDLLVESEGPEHRSVQAWLEQVQEAMSIGETTLASSAIELTISAFAEEEKLRMQKVRRMLMYVSIC